MKELSPTQGEIAPTHELKLKIQKAFDRRLPPNQEECNKEQTIHQFKDDLVNFISIWTPSDRSWSLSDFPSLNSMGDFGAEAVELALGRHPEGARKQKARKQSVIKKEEKSDSAIARNRGLHGLKNRQGSPLTPLGDYL